MASNNVQLLYQHPHITIYLEDNTVQSVESSVENDAGLYGIQVGAFESGRDNIVLRYTNTEQFISELGELNHEIYGQAGYNAYNALNSKSCGMYIMRCTADDAAFANKVIMAKFKVQGKKETTEEIINHVDTSASLADGLNLFSDMGSDVQGSFSLYGNVVSGLTGISEVDGLFSHITPDWLNGKGLPKFSIATVRISVPNGVTPGTTVKITQISQALKTFYADFGQDSENIVASGNTATKTREYPVDELLPSGSISFDLSMIIQENDTVSVSIEWNDAASTVTDYTFNSANVVFTDATATVDDTVTEDTGSVDDGKVRLEISYYATSFENVTSEEDLKLKYAALFSDNVDEEGYYNMPFMLLYSLGRGAYGNNLRVKFTDAMEYDADDVDYRRYCMTVMQLTREGLKTRETIRGSISETAWDTSTTDGLSAYIQDLTNDIEYGSQKINVDLCEQTLDKMLELYNTEVADGVDVPVLEATHFDPLFGLDMFGEVNDSIIRSSYVGNEEVVNLEAIDGFPLSNGSDGAMTYKPKMTAEEQATYAKAYETSLIRAFEDVPTGEVVNGKEVMLSVHDRMLKSKYSTPADFMFDANFPDSVKIAMAKFANEREYDCMTYLDSGMCTTAAECIAWLKSMSDVYGYNVVKELHCYKYRDARFTRKIVPMTITHWLSGALPYHLSTYGLGTPFARKYAKLVAGTDYIAGSFFPIIDPDDHETKREIYKYRANCYESLDRRTVQRTSAITTCQENSDRMEEFNEYILHRAIKIAYEIMNSNIYKMIDEESILAYTEHAEKEISYVLAGLVTNVTVTMESTAADRKKSILRLILHIEFATVAKYGAVEVYLDPRGTAQAAAEAAATYTG